MHARSSKGIGFSAFETEKLSCKAIQEVTQWTNTQLDEWTRLMAQQDDPFPVDLDYLYVALGARPKAKEPTAKDWKKVRDGAIKLLKEHGIEGRDYKMLPADLKSAGSILGSKYAPKDRYFLSPRFFGEFCMLSKAPNATRMRAYYLDCHEQYLEMKYGTPSNIELTTAQQHDPNEFLKAATDEIRKLFREEAKAEIGKVLDYQENAQKVLNILPYL